MNGKRITSLLATAGLLGTAALAACTAGSNVTDPAPKPVVASARLQNAAGAVVGTAALRQGSSGAVVLEVTATGLTPGAHGIHLHAVGSCETPAGGATFAAAGGHFNPTGKGHGLENPGGAHGGDLPNLDVAADGTGRLVTTTDRVTLTEGALSLLDADGSAVVIHAAADDHRSDPAGNSGARVACGVIGR